MKRLPALSAQDTQELRVALEQSTPPNGQPLSLDGMLSRWNTLVTEVERGYRLTAYDYSNDLSVRDRLEEVIGRVRGDLRAKIAAVLQPLDDRFDRATVESPKPLSAGRPFWWKRIPRKRDPEFDATL